MKNDDLKRFYDVCAVPERKKDFVRYEDNKSILTPYNATKNDEVVNYQTLIKHAGGAGADINYRGAWISGMEIAQYDVVYINNIKTRVYYMATNNITSSTTSPSLDTDNWIVFLETEREHTVEQMPIASLEYLDEIYQYVGQTNANYVCGYFYKCYENVEYYTVVTSNMTFYCESIPTLGQEVELYDDNTLTTLNTRYTFSHITTGYYVHDNEEGADPEMIDCEYSEVYNYTWNQLDTQPRVATEVSYLTNAPTEDNTDGNLKFVVLSSEPAIRYSGYYYIITE